MLTKRLIININNRRAKESNIYGKICNYINEEARKFQHNEKIESTRLDAK